MPILVTPTLALSVFLATVMSIALLPVGHFIAMKPLGPGNCHPSLFTRARIELLEDNKYIIKFGLLLKLLNTELRLNQKVDFTS
jgi:hypothetical protein